MKAVIKDTVDHEWAERGRFLILNSNGNFSIYKNPEQNGRYLFSVEGPRRTCVCSYADTIDAAKEWVETIYEWHSVPAYVRCPFPLAKH